MQLLDDAQDDVTKVTAYGLIPKAATAASSNAAYYRRMVVKSL